MVSETMVVGNMVKWHRHKQCPWSRGQRCKVRERMKVLVVRGKGSWHGLVQRLLEYIGTKVQSVTMDEGP